MKDDDSIIKNNHRWLIWTIGTILFILFAYVVSYERMAQTQQRIFYQKKMSLALNDKSLQNTQIVHVEKIEESLEWRSEIEAFYSISYIHFKEYPSLKFKIPINVGNPEKNDAFLLTSTSIDNSECVISLVSQNNKELMLSIDEFPAHKNTSCRIIKSNDMYMSVD